MNPLTNPEFVNSLIDYRQHDLLQTAENAVSSTDSIRNRLGSALIRFGEHVRGRVSPAVSEEEREVALRLAA